VAPQAGRPPAPPGPPPGAGEPAAPVLPLLARIDVNVGRLAGEAAAAAGLARLASTAAVRPPRVDVAGLGRPAGVLPDLRPSVADAAPVARLLDGMERLRATLLDRAAERVVPAGPAATPDVAALIVRQFAGLDLAALRGPAPGVPGGPQLQPSPAADGLTERTGRAILDALRDLADDVRSKRVVVYGRG